MFDLPDPLPKFYANRSGATSRGIDWKLTFDEWWGLWKPHYHLRGRGPGKMNLCREADQGCYEIGNVRIDTFAANMKENGKIIHLAAKARHTNNAAARSTRFHNHPGYIKHFFPQSVELMDPAKKLMAKQELEAALREFQIEDPREVEMRRLELHERIAAFRARTEASRERQLALRAAQKQKK